jgi:Tfp pilus assembly pilus retraction ATPase PilT
MSLNVINEIRNQIKQIPSEKDRKIANTFLDKRDFNSLKELVDSDVTKQFKKVNRLLNNVETADTEESLTAQMIYSELKELQEMVAPHVIDYDSFIHEYEYDDYFNEGNDIEYYD